MCTCTLHSESGSIPAHSLRMMYDIVNIFIPPGSGTAKKGRLEGVAGLMLQ